MRYDMENKSKLIHFAKMWVSSQNLRRQDVISRKKDKEVYYANS